MPLNILQIGSCFPAWGGAELHVLNLSEQLAARGHRVTVACRSGRFVEAEARKRGLRTIPITVAFESDWSAFPAFLNLFRNETFNVAHVHWPTVYLVGPTAAKLRGVPVVLSHHSPDPLRVRVGDALTPETLFHRVIALSEWVHSNLIHHGLEPHQVVTIHHGTVVASFTRPEHSFKQTRERWGVPPGAFVAAQVGQVGRHKGGHIFVEALSRLKARPDAPPIFGVIVGDGPALPGLRDQARAAGLTEKELHFAGYTASVADAMHGLDALILSSVWQEPCAAVVQQAMAARKPVIGTRTGGTPEMVAHEETGLLVPPGNPDALADALSHLARLPAASRAAMGNAGYERVVAQFSLTEMVDRVEAVYRAIVATG